MGPDSEGRNLSHKFYLLSICLVFAIFPWCISCGTNETKSLEARGKGEESSDSNNSTVLNGSYASDNDYVDTGEIFRNQLINHTLTNGGEEDLDKLIFSALPQGSKLILQSVKVVQTDEHGNLVKHSKKAPVHWDMKITNATTEPSDTTEEESEEEDENEEEQGSQLTPAETKTALLVVSSTQPDQAISGSHSRANYKVYGSKDLGKEVEKVNHHGQDSGKNHKITYTDTDGKKVTKYIGKEAGIKDHAHDNKKAQSDEGERYRDTKKKNKGRRVSGFKRIYHKEEFQRTEHFYDDEDAKRIAESYGLKDAIDKSNHGTKDDDRKYKGNRTEYTDGKKIKDEKITSNGFNKGHQTKYKDTEKHRQNSNYAKSEAHGSPNNNQNYHPSHNYQGSSYSHTHPKITAHNANVHYPNNYFMNFKPGYVQANFKPSTISHLHGNNNDMLSAMAKIPLTASFVLTDLEKDSSTASSTDVPTTIMNKKESKSKKIKSRLDKKILDENKMYFSPRNRKVLEGDFKQVGNKPKQPYPHYQWNNFPVTTFHSKLGNVSGESWKKTGGGRESERYGRKYSPPPSNSGSTVRNTLLDPAYGGYSTLVKIMPVNYINLGEEIPSNPKARNISQIETSESEHEQERDVVPLIIDGSPPQYYRKRPPHSRPPPKDRWLSLSLSVGDPEMIKDVEASPFNQNQPFDRDVRPLSISNLVRGVKNRLIRPVPFKPRFYPPHQHHHPHDRGHQLDSQYIDTSKQLPLNIIVKSVNGTSHNKNYKQHRFKNSQDHNPVSFNNSAHYTRKPYNGVLNRPGAHGHSGYINRVPNNNNNRNRAPLHMPPFMNSLMDSVANFFSNVG